MSISSDELRHKEFSRILLIKPSALGDVVHTIPVLAKLRARYPEARIDWMLTPENAELVRCHPALSNVVIFARRELARIGRSHSATAGFFSLLSKLRRARYDLVIDLHGQLRSAFFALATKAPVRIGFARPVKTAGHGWTGAREGSWLAYTHHIPIPTLDVHAVDRYLWLGDILGFDGAPPDFTMYLPPESEQRAESLLNENGPDRKPFALLVPGTMWETKHWTVEGFAGVAKALLGDGFAVGLVGTGRDRERCAAISGQAEGVRDFCGKTTPAELAALIRKASLCVTNDSGAMHLATALGCRVVAIFGPTNPLRIGPYRHPESVIRLELPCSPCNFRRLSQCPYDHRCMRELSVEAVLSRCREMERGSSSQ